MSEKNITIAHGNRNFILAWEKMSNTEQHHAGKTVTLEEFVKFASKSSMQRLLMAIADTPTTQKKEQEHQYRILSQEQSMRFFDQFGINRGKAMVAGGVLRIRNYRNEQFVLEFKPSYFKQHRQMAMSLVGEFRSTVRENNEWRLAGLNGMVGAKKEG